MSLKRIIFRTLEADVDGPLELLTALQPGPIKTQFRRNSKMVAADVGKLLDDNDG
jgi:hypothetical protein